jgi:hypothetical protein
MLKQITISFLFTLLTLPSHAQGLSAHREPTQTYKMIRGDAVPQTTSTIRTPEQVKVDLSQLDISLVPEISDPTLFAMAFNYLRDTRFIQTADSSFSRRLTWLYPDDGCYARAELESIYAQEMSLPAPSKVFAFGDLRAATNNSPSGYVTWWYHVSIAYKHKGNVYIFDPSVESSFPLTIEQWGQLMGLGKTKIEFSLCSSKTLDPTHDCINPNGISVKKALQEQSVFLNLEWQRIEYLGRDPKSELGEKPPWLATRDLQYH